MAFESFTSKTSSGAFHQRRAIAYAAAACVLVGLGIASAKMGGKPDLQPKEEETIDVKFTEEIPEEEPQNEPPPPPPPEPAAPPVVVPKTMKVNHEPPPPPPEVPTEIPKGKLDEADPSKDKGVYGSHDGDPSGQVGGKPGGTGTAKIDAPPPPPPPPPAPTAPPKPKAQLVSENDTPAKGLSTPPPQYPAAMRTAGITGVVVVRLTIDEHGNVVDAKIVKGDPNFDAAVLEAVKKWKYEPAKHEDGKPFLSTKVVKVPFKIKS